MNTTTQLALPARRALIEAPFPKQAAKHLLRTLGPTRRRLRQRLGLVIRKVNEG